MKSILLAVFVACLPAKSWAEGDYTDSIVAGSDDIELYGSVFLEAANSLIKSKKCSAADFKEMGGWLKSMNDKTKPIYFTYCGEYRVYVNAKTGKTEIR